MSKSDNIEQGEVSSAKLRSFVERIERLEEQKKEIQMDITDVYAEVKSMGFDVKTVRRIVKERKMTPQERAEQDALFDLYKAALGVLDGTPLGAAAIDRLKKEKKAKAEKEPEAQDAPPEEHWPLVKEAA